MSSDIAREVPEEAIVAAFAGTLAISPDIYMAKIKRLATQHGVPCDGALNEHVRNVLARQEPIDPDLF
jgi:hypothetical protein